MTRDCNCEAGDNPNLRGKHTASCGSRFTFGQFHEERVATLRLDARVENADGGGTGCELLVRIEGDARMVAEARRRIAAALGVKQAEHTDEIRELQARAGVKL